MFWSARKASSRIPYRQVAFRDRFSNHRAGPDDRSITDGDPLENDGASPDENTASYYNRPGGEDAVRCPAPISGGGMEIIIDQHGSRSNNGLFPDPD